MLEFESYYLSTPFLKIWRRKNTNGEINLRHCNRFGVEKLNLARLASINTKNYRAHCPDSYDILFFCFFFVFFLFVRFYFLWS